MTLALRKLSRFVWEIPREGKMRVAGRLYVSESQLAALRTDQALEQVVNVAHLPGIVGASLAMPDIHWGYGFPIGGVAAVDAESGAVSPGGVGYDINCGCRVITTQLHVDDVRNHLHAIVAKLFATIPTGMGAGRAIPRLSPRELGELMTQGADWAVALPARPAQLSLAVQLGREGPRLPGEDRWTPALKGAPGLPLLQLDGRHASDPAKIVLALRAFSKGLFRDTFVLKS